MPTEPRRNTPWCPYCMTEVSLYGSDHVVEDEGGELVLTECNVYGRTL